jgi:predicted MFS family arabinose efflux permease
MLSWTAITSFWAFVTIWGARELHATGTELGLTFLASAVAAACVSYLGGRLADMIGDRPILLTSRAGLAVVALAAAVAEPGLALGLGLIIAASIVNALAAPVEQTLIVAAVPPADQEAAFSVARVAQTIGFTIGPLLGAALLFAGWPVLFAGVAVLALSTVVVAGALLPARAARDTQKARAALSPFRDPRFTGFLVVGSVAMTAYFAYELVLPVSLVQSHGVAPWTWGALAAVMPVMIAVLQVRVIAALRALPGTTKLAIALLLMGPPFLLITVSAALPVILVMIVVLAFGVIIWGPTSQAVVARFAPAGAEGVYFGAYRATFSVGVALAPFVGLQIRESFGDSAVWFFVGGLTLVGALLLPLILATGTEPALDRQRDASDATAARLS